MTPTHHTLLPGTSPAGLEPVGLSPAFQAEPNTSPTGSYRTPPLDETTADRRSGCDGVAADGVSRPYVSSGAGDRGCHPPANATPSGTNDNISVHGEVN